MSVTPIDDDDPDAGWVFIVQSPSEVRVASVFAANQDALDAASAWHRTVDVRGCDRTDESRGA